MKCPLQLISVYLLAAAGANASAVLPSKPFAEALSKRWGTGGSTNNLTVDLGYEIYVGTNNATTGINTFKGFVPILS
jgi:hypothetical protein